MLDTNVTIAGFTRADFDKKKIRKTLRIEGRAIQKIARKLIGRKAISRPGEFPGKQTGMMIRSIKVKVSRSGFLVRIAPEKIPGMKDFYPAFLHYGSTKNNLAPRKNNMTEALDARRDISRNAILRSLQDSIIPRR
ncbi:MAG TPA: hypothetical protein VK974_04735 [Methylophilaceae bacterium]|nr:hypothetical protein [Methylophilaceae bacterium]